MIITDLTVCINCKKPAGAHCDVENHFLRHCPKRCPDQGGDPIEKYFFCPPQGPVYKDTTDKDHNPVRLLIRPADEGWSA